MIYSKKGKKQKGSKRRAVGMTDASVNVRDDDMIKKESGKQSAGSVLLRKKEEAKASNSARAYFSPGRPLDEGHCRVVVLVC